MKIPDILPLVAMDSINSEGFPCADICTEDNGGFTFIGEITSREVAEYLVMTGNMHHKLVEALEKTIINVAYSATKGGLETPKWLEDINELLKRAKHD